MESSLEGRSALPESKKTSSTILIVDDQDAIRTFVSRLLSERYTVLVAESGEDAHHSGSEQKSTLRPGMCGVRSFHNAIRRSWMELNWSFVG